MATTDFPSVTDTAQALANRPATPLPSTDGHGLPVATIITMDDEAARASKAALSKRKLGCHTDAEIRGWLV